MFFNIALLFRQQRSFDFPLSKDLEGAAGNSVVLQFDQFVDHFDNTNKRTFKQKYIINDEFCVENNCTIFFFIGGESALRNTVLDGGKYSISFFAQKIKGVQLALEHRFYGESYPTGDDRDLKFLSSRQALADIVEFLSAIKKQPKYSGSKVVVSGGSYPGAMAAWLRSQFPHLIDVALSSSGPVLAENDYTSYLDHIQGQMELGGCKTELQETLEYAESLLNSTKENADEFKAAFNISDTIDLTKLDDLNFANVIEAVTDGIAGLVQYALPFNHTGIEEKGQIQAYCDKLKEKVGNASRLAFIGSQNPLHNAKLAYTDYIEATKQDGSWFYQTCTEFGYYQTGTFEGSIFSKKITLDYFMSICKDAFFNDMLEKQLTIEETKIYVDQMINYTNAFYGARNIPRSQVYYTNGGVDPWSELAVLPTQNWKNDGQYIHSNTAVEIIKDGSHCTDMYLTWKMNDAIRNRQLAKIQEWLK